MSEEYDPRALVDKWLPVWEERGTHLTDDSDDKPRQYVVSMFPYPSGDLHMGHAEVYSISDAIARFARLRGYNVFNPIGWDSFGLPAENAALKRGLDPRDWTYDNIAVQAEGFRRLGVSFDWRGRLHTSDPEYYRWNQWLFLRLYERGLAYRKGAPVNWCPTDQTVLANEQVIAGRCERCGTEAVRRTLTQWFFRITDYAQRLLDDMPALEWPEDVLAMQRNWIGRSTGAYIDFVVEGRDEPVRVFSTRPDTLYGATFFVIAADAPLAAELCVADRKRELAQYREKTATASDLDRLSADRPKTGVFLGVHAVNPATGERIPVYASDYVLADYGTGAIMAVPAHDQRDLDFATALGLPVRVVVDDGVLVNSGPYNGMAATAAATAIAEDLGEPAIIYRLRDWLVSRQRYWGTPIPIVHCDRCGEVPVPDDQLPVELPASGYDLRPGDGRSPLASATDWVDVACPACGGAAQRDTDTMDTFVDSSWYFLRYPDPTFDKGPFNPGGVERWLPVGEYIGGKVQATMHLLYARFVTKVLHDMGLVPFTEPFLRLTNQGQVLMNGKAMSKSLGNLVNLRDEIARYGPDAARVAMLFANPPEDDVDWADVSPTGAAKWLSRVWRLAGDVPPPGAGVGDPAVRRGVHRLIDETTSLMERKRFNVAVARLMELTSLLRKAVDRGPGGADPAVREGVEALVRMLSCIAPFTAEEAWERLGHPPSVSDHGWPVADGALLVEETVTCVVQVVGKVRDRLRVPAGIGAEELTQLALQSARARQALDGRAVTQVVVRAPKLVNLVTER